MIFMDKPIRIEMDWGFSEGRQYGRAPDGNQRRHYLNSIKNDNEHRQRHINRRNGNYQNRNGNYRRDDHYGNYQHQNYNRRRDRNYDNDGYNYSNKRSRY